ncbi:MAG: hypothetical protein F6K37_42275 [Moorea sp. SIO4E2]|nr:hypothetical protein [Moorena sp. SIO4E2]
MLPNCHKLTLFVLARIPVRHFQIFHPNWNKRLLESCVSQAGHALAPHLPESLFPEALEAL